MVRTCVIASQTSCAVSVPCGLAFCRYVVHGANLGAAPTMVARRRHAKPPVVYHELVEQRGEDVRFYPWHSAFYDISSRLSAFQRVYNLWQSFLKLLHLAGFEFIAVDIEKRQADVSVWHLDRVGGIQFNALYAQFLL